MFSNTIITESNIKKALRLLVDSGSDICLIRLTEIRNDKINIEKINLKIAGVSGQLQVLGKTDLNLLIGCKTYVQEFLVVDNKIQIPADGILGRDFMTKYGVTLDYENALMAIGEDKIKIHMGIVGAVGLDTHCKRVLEALEREFQELESLDRRVEKKVREMVVEFSDIFKLEDEVIPPNNFYTQKIHLKDEMPVFVRQYRLPHLHKEEIKRQVEDLLSKGIIRPSDSDYNNPNLLVPKKNGKFRMVTDFRELNKKLIKDKYPMPRFEDVFDKMGGDCSDESGPKFFAIFDLTKGFYQIPLEEDACKFTAFSTDFGFFEYVRLPFGLAIAPNGFSRMMARAFEKLLLKEFYLFMDDLVAWGQSKERLLEGIQSVFEVCRERNLSLNPEKVKFFKTKVVYLGHELNENGIYPDVEKFQVIEKYPIPSCKDEVKTFVAFANFYRKFVPNFAKIALPLNQLTRKKVVFKWSEECQCSFNIIKKALMTPPILKYPNFRKMFIISTDASDLALGAVLSQNYGGKDMPIHYASRTMTKGESRKSTIEKELAAIHWAILYFKPYVYGRHFKIKTDHRPLVYLFSLKNPTSKLNRMRLEIEEFDFEVVYVPGKQNSVADALSRVTIKDLKDQYKWVLAVTTRLKKKQEEARNSTLDCLAENPSTVESPKILEALGFDVRGYPELVSNLGAREISAGYNLHRQNRRVLFKVSVHVPGMLGAAPEKRIKKIKAIFAELENKCKSIDHKNLRIRTDDELFSKISRDELKIAAEALNTVKLYFYRAPVQVTDEKERIRLVQHFHENPLMGGHSGYGRLLAKLKSVYVWKGMSRQVRDFIKNCIKCQMNKPSKRTIEQLCITETPEKAFDLIAIDTVGPLPISLEGYKYLLTIQCNLSKFVVAAPMRDKSACSVARALFSSFVYIHGFFKAMRTDKGTEFCNEVIEELNKICCIEHRTSAGYRPQTIGSLERNHRTLNEYFRSYLNESHSNWPVMVKFYVFAYNSTPNYAVANYTPYELVYGRKPNLPDFLEAKEIEPIYNIDNYVKELKYKLQTAQIKAREFLLKGKEDRKRKYDETSKPININVGDKIKIRKENANKFDPKYMGPYEVVSIETPNAIVKAQTGKSIKIHMDRIAKC